MMTPQCSAMLDEAQAGRADESLLKIELDIQLLEPVAGVS